MSDRTVSLIKSARKVTQWQHILQGILAGKELVVADQMLNCGPRHYHMELAHDVCGDIVMLREDFEKLPGSIEMGSFNQPKLDFGHVEYVLDIREFQVLELMNNKAHAKLLLDALGQ